MVLGIDKKYETLSIYLNTRLVHYFDPASDINMFSKIVGSMSQSEFATWTQWGTEQWKFY